MKLDYLSTNNPTFNSYFRQVSADFLYFLALRLKLILSLWTELYTEVSIPRLHHFVSQSCFNKHILYGLTRNIGCLFWLQFAEWPFTNITNNQNSPCERGKIKFVTFSWRSEPEVITILTFDWLKSKTRIVSIATSCDNHKILYSQVFNFFFRALEGFRAN